MRPPGLLQSGEVALYSGDCRVRCPANFPCVSGFTEVSKRFLLRGVCLVADLLHLDDETSIIPTLEREHQIGDSWTHALGLEPRACNRIARAAVRNGEQRE